ncbi:DoxX-like family protein [Acinetobacter venetianus]|uniref:DoxX-like family protein n=1 Tax=Acinetobacter venetianus TaxID=52133 RepID=UPI000778413D|nr:DoxX-like family protein [Acinetobacter venetianus]KXZ63463.1 hypothetical protein AVENLUH7437_02631 [Acinetobacter venetianus]
MKNAEMALHRVLKFCQLMIALLWIYQGLFPKFIFQVADEKVLWQFIHIPTSYITDMIVLSGIAEIIFGSLFLFIKHQYLHYLNLLGLTLLFLCVLLIYPDRIYQAFNPVVMNFGLGSLSVIALWCIDAQKIKPE